MLDLVFGKIAASVAERRSVYDSVKRFFVVRTASADGDESVLRER